MTAQICGKFTAINKISRYTVNLNLTAFGHFKIKKASTDWKEGEGEGVGIRTSWTWIR